MCFFNKVLYFPFIGYSSHLIGRSDFNYRLDRVYKGHKCIYSSMN